MTHYEAIVIVRVFDSYLDSRTEDTKAKLIKILESLELSRNYESSLLSHVALKEQYEKDPY